MTTYAGKETSKITILTVAVDQDDPRFMLFEWQEPTYLGGLTINAYRVEI